MTTSRAGGLHLPPWGIPHAEPIGSSNCPPLAVIAPPPQTWLLSSSLPCVKGGGTATGFPEASLRALGIRGKPWRRDCFIILLHEYNPSVSFADSSLCTREPPLRRELCKAKAFWNHQHCWWFSFNKKKQPHSLSGLRLPFSHSKPRSQLTDTFKILAISRSS